MNPQDVMSRISQTESLLGTTTTVRPKSAASFQDEFGDETYFIENVSSMDVVLTDLEEKGSYVLIDRGQVTDLLSKAYLENIKRSMQIKKCFETNLLVRLTKEQYESKLLMKAENAKRIARAKEEGAANPAKTSVSMAEPRFSTKAKVDKLRMYYSPDKDMASFGISPFEFMEWASTERFEDGEIDYIVSMIDDADVRSFLYKRKAQLFG